MDKKKFPNNFIFGTAVASYQVEGGIYNNDWTIWENNKNSKCEELCGEACKHYELVYEEKMSCENKINRKYDYWSDISKYLKKTSTFASVRSFVAKRRAGKTLVLFNTSKSFFLM